MERGRNQIRDGLGTFGIIMVYKYQAKKIVTVPAAEPLALAEMRTFLYLSAVGSPASNPQDDYVTALILAARKRAESDLQRALISQTWDIFYDCFPNNEIIPVPLPPLQSVTTIKYFDPSGTEQTLSDSTYLVDANSQPARITPTEGNSWPSIQVRTNAVTVRIVTGYGDASTDVPADILMAMKIAVGHWFENRQEVVVGATASEVPFAYKALIQSHRMLQV